MGERGGNANTGAKAPGEMTAKDGTEPIFGQCGDASLSWYYARTQLYRWISHLTTRDVCHAAHMVAEQDAQAPMRNWVV
jgi:hypothetical protein